MSTEKHIKTVAFVYLHGNTYRCSETDEQSGRYVRLDVARDLVEALELASDIVHDLPNDDRDPALDEVKKLCRAALRKAYGEQ